MSYMLCFAYFAFLQTNYSVTGNVSKFLEIYHFIDFVDFVLIIDFCCWWLLKSCHFHFMLLIISSVILFLQIQTLLNATQVKTLTEGEFGLIFRFYRWHLICSIELLFYLQKSISHWNKALLNCALNLF